MLRRAYFNVHCAPKVQAKHAKLTEEQRKVKDTCPEASLSLYTINELMLYLKGKHDVQFCFIHKTAMYSFASHIEQPCADELLA